MTDIETTEEHIVVFSVEYSLPLRVPRGLSHDELWAAAEEAYEEGEDWVLEDHEILSVTRRG